MRATWGNVPSDVRPTKTWISCSSVQSDQSLLGAPGEAKDKNSLI